MMKINFLQIISRGCKTDGAGVCFMDPFLPRCVGKPVLYRLQATVQLFTRILDVHTNDKLVIYMFIFYTCTPYRINVSCYIPITNASGKLLSTMTAAPLRSEETEAPVDVELGTQLVAVSDIRMRDIGTSSTREATCHVVSTI